MQKCVVTLGLRKLCLSYVVPCRCDLVAPYQHTIMLVTLCLTNSCSCLLALITEKVCQLILSERNWFCCFEMEQMLNLAKLIAIRSWHNLGANKVHRTYGLTILLAL